MRSFRVRPWHAWGATRQSGVVLSAVSNIILMAHPGQPSDTLSDMELGWHVTFVVCLSKPRWQETLTHERSINLLCSDGGG